MYKLITSILFMLLAVLNVNSQTTLTSSNSPSIGDLQTQVTVDTTGITPGNQGANQLWSFTNLVRIDSNVNQWIDPAATPYGSLFPQSNVCSLDTCYNYFKGSSPQFEYVGYYSHSTAVNYSNFETILSYPFTYNSTFSDNFSAVINLNGDVLYRTGTVNVIGDAYGILNLTFGIYLNALRLKHTIHINDSSTTYHMAITTDYTVYEWYVPGKKFAVFNIVYTTITIPGYGTIHQKNVHYNPNSTPIGIQPIGSNVPKNYSLAQNYPNPFNPSTKIAFDIPRASFTRLTIFDILGREIASPVNEQLIPGHYEVNFEASSYPSGVYFYRLSTNEFVETKRMMIIK